jgi:hypothetical protein
MPIATWYRHKAAQCGRLADDACDSEQRAKFEEEGRLSRMLARERRQAIEVAHYDTELVRWVVCLSIWTTFDVAACSASISHSAAISR